MTQEITLLQHKCKNCKYFIDIEPHEKCKTCNGKYCNYEPPKQSYIALAEKWEKDFEKEKRDVAIAGYSDDYKTGIYEGLRLAVLIIRENMINKKAI